MINVKKINKSFRAKDDSHLWPINGEFNATDRAIRRIAKLQKESGGCYYDCEYSYQLTLENEISQIVNNCQ